MDQNKKIDEIHAALVGDQYRKGLIADVETLKTQNFLNKIIVAVLSGISLIFSGF